MRITDRMMVIGIGLGIVYWIIETFLYLFDSSRLDFFPGLFGPGPGGIATRIIVLCLFIIFGSHAQYTLNKLKKTSEQVEHLRSENQQLRRQIADTAPAEQVIS